MAKESRFLRNLINRTDVLVLDTETTGFTAKSEIVEIAIIDTTGAVRLNELVLPQQARVPAKAVEIHGLSKPKLRQLGARPWPEVHERVCKLISGCDQLLVYNLEFDIRMLEQTAARYGLLFPPTGPAAHCLMKGYAELRRVRTEWGRGYKWHKLEDALRFEGGKVVQTHRALDDCRMALELLRLMANRIDRILDGPHSTLAGAATGQGRPNSDKAGLGCLGTLILIVVLALQSAC